MFVGEVGGALPYKQVRRHASEGESLRCVVKEEAGERDWVLDL
jgi:hypothetical protein